MGFFRNPPGSDGPYVKKEKLWDWRWVLVSIPVGIILWAVVLWVKA